MDEEVKSKNTRRMINITDLANKLTALICDALPSYHAFTAAFTRKAKWMPFMIIKGDEKFTSAMKQIGKSDGIDTNAAATTEYYMCTVYSLWNHVTLVIILFCAAGINSSSFAIPIKDMSYHAWKIPLAETTSRPVVLGQPIMSARVMPIRVELGTIVNTASCSYWQVSHRVQAPCC